MARPLRSPALKPVIHVRNSVDPLLVCQSIGDNELIAFCKALVGSQQHGIVDASAAGSPESDRAAGALNTGSLQLLRQARPDYRRALPVDESVPTIVIDLAKQGVREHSPRVIHTQDHTVRYLALHSN